MHSTTISMGLDVLGKEYVLLNNHDYIIVLDRIHILPEDEDSIQLDDPYIEEYFDAGDDMMDDDITINQSLFFSFFGHF